MGEKIYIYGLVDPRDGHVKYVGKTDAIDRRLREHIKDTKSLNRGKIHWIQKLVRLGLEPELRILCESTPETWKQDECRLMAEMSEIHPIYNVAPGGIGGTRPNAGRPMTDLRMLDISNVGIAFDQPVEYCAEGLVVTQCGACGAVSWEPYHVRVSPIEPQLGDGDGFGITLATVQMAGRQAKHHKNCINK